MILFSPFTLTANATMQTLEQAKTLVVETDFVSLNKSYNVSVEGEKVAEVEGKYLPLFGDTLTLEDLNGNELGSERQIKRWNIKLNRLAEIMDESGVTEGYIGEKVIQNFFNLGYTFHFYDAHKDELGYAREKVFRLFDEYVIYNEEDEPLYKIKQKFSLFNRKYEITVYDESTIPVEQSIYLTCILDAVEHAKKKQSWFNNSSSTKKK